MPFAMLTGMLLDNNIFTNVEVSNGKLINDGDRTAIIGFAFPGLQNNLNIDKEDFEIPDYIEISADVKNFEFGITITIAANELLIILTQINWTLQKTFWMHSMNLTVL